MQIKNLGPSQQTIFVRAQSYTIIPGATLVLPDRDMVAARRAVRDLPSMKIMHGNDMAEALSNLTATADPTVNDDVDLGYSVGSKWVNVSTQEEWTCFSPINGLAVWKRAGSGAGLETGSVLPTPNLSRRGKQFMVLGGPQTPDIIYVCMKDYLDNYVWNEMVVLG